MPENTTRSLTRAIAILKTVCQAQSTGIRLAAITRATALSKTTTIRLIQTLVAEEMLARQPDGAYVLGPAAHALGRQDSHRSALTSAARSVLRRRAIAWGDAAFLSIRHDLHSICLIREDRSYPLKTHVLQPGTRLPLGVGAGGIAMLAALSDDAIERCMAANHEECK